MNTRFISDLHLSTDQPAATAAFCEFLRGLVGTTATLYILGDLFEAWIGDDDPSALARDVVAALRQLTAGGVQVLFQRGNRDFAIGKRFARETGCILLADEHIIDLQGERALIVHGDTLCTGDIAYQKFRRRIRHPLVLGILRRLPLRVRQQIALHGRARSAAINRNKAEYIMDVAADAVVAAMTRYGVQTLIHGHTHRPGVHPLTINGKPARRFVLGDWADNGWVLTANHSGLELAKFPIPRNATSPTHGR
ncbi:MAG: UDP-2,3-diacylglucosamine diphosphatase [Porticoccaceae bacterium]